MILSGPSWPDQPWGPSCTVSLREAFKFCVGDMPAICLSEDNEGTETETIGNWVYD